MMSYEDRLDTMEAAFERIEEYADISFDEGDDATYEMLKRILARLVAVQTKFMYANAMAK